MMGGVDKHRGSKMIPKYQLTGGKQSFPKIVEQNCSATEAVQGLSLAFQRVDNVERSDSLAASVFSVCHGIANDILQKDLQNSTRFLVYEAADSLDSSPSGEPADGGLCNAVDIIAQDLAMALGAGLAESFSAFPASTHLVDFR